MRKVVLMVFSIFLFSCATNNFQIKFVKDKSYDEKMIYNMFKYNDPAGLESRSKSMGIDFQFATIIRNSVNFSEIEKELNELVDSRYQKMENVINDSIEGYQKAWNEIINEFSNEVQNVIGEKWFYNTYYCVISPFHPGISNWNGNKVVRKCGEDPINQRRITAHEVVLSQVFQVCRKYYDKRKVDDWKIWAISEITTVFILDESKMLKYWGNYNPPENYFSKSNYPQLADLEQQLKILYKQKLSFKSYIDNAIKVSL